MSKLSRRRRLAVGGAIAVASSLLSIPVRSADLTLSPEDLLRRTDVGALAPESFRSRLRLVAGDKPPLEVEVWRKGESRTLVRLLGPKERGKYLLRLGSVALVPGPGGEEARAPRPVLPAARQRDPRRRARPAVRARLQSERGGPTKRRPRRARARPRADRAPIYPAVRYVVRPSTLRPVRAEYRLPSGKVATIVEFAQWSDGRPPLREPAAHSRCAPRRGDDGRGRPRGGGAAGARRAVRPRRPVRSESVGDGAKESVITTTARTPNSY